MNQQAPSPSEEQPEKAGGPVSRPPIHRGLKLPETGRVTSHVSGGGKAPVMRFAGIAALAAAGLAGGWAMGLETSALALGAGLFALGVGGGLAGYRASPFHKRASREYHMLREVLEGSRGARLITDPNNRTFYANLRFHSLVDGQGDRTLDTLSGLFSNNAGAADSFRELAAQAQTGNAQSVDLPAHIAGNDVWLQVTAQPVTGWPGFIHWRVDDITARRELENIIRGEREKLRDFTDNAPIGFFSVDEHGHFLFVNKTLATWLGTTVQELRRGDKVLHDFLVNKPEDGRDCDLLPGQLDEQIGEIPLRALDGREFLAAFSHIVVSENGRSIRTRSVIRDLTPEHEMEEALKVSEARFQRFFEEAPLGIVLLDSRGVVSECNPAFVNMVGLEEKDIRGKLLTSMVTDRAERETISAHLERINGGEEPDFSDEITLHGGREIVAQLYARKFKESENIVVHFIDLTEKKSLEQQFAQSQKMQAVGQLAGGVAHDFNNLLTAMIGFCDLLLLRHKPGDPSFSDIMQIKQNANRAANLVRQLLAFSRQQTLQPRVLDVTDVLTDVSHLLRRLIGANIDLKIVHGQDLGLVKVDQGQLEQVLMNLVVNARDAMPDGGDMTIRTGNYENKKKMRLGTEEMPPGQFIAIEVEDTGTGIPKENLTRIFEPFFTTKELGAGTGLGLSTVYGIVRQTGGFLAVKSKMGAGTTFTIYLPSHTEVESKSDKAAEVSVEEERGADLTGSARIYLVEDEDAVRTFSARALSNKGYQVMDAPSAEVALDMLEKDEQGPDLMITDVVMPQMDGPTLARKALEMYPDLRIIFISGYSEDRFKDEFDNDNIYFLPKPFTLKQLATKVKEVIDAEG